MTTTFRTSPSARSGWCCAPRRGRRPGAGRDDERRTGRRLDGRPRSPSPRRRPHLDHRARPTERTEGRGIDLAVTEFLTSAWSVSSAYATPTGRCRATEIWYIIAPWARGEGYASEAALATAQWLFRDQRFERLELRTAADNTASQQVAQKIGCISEGVLRRACIARTRTEDGHLGRSAHRLHLWSLLPEDLDGVAEQLADGGGSAAVRRLELTDLPQRGTAASRVSLPTCAPPRAAPRPRDDPGRLTTMADRVTVIGWDGSPLTAAARSALGAATLVAGAAHHLALPEVPAERRAHPARQRRPRRPQDRGPPGNRRRPRRRRPGLLRRRPYPARPEYGLEVEVVPAVSLRRRRLRPRRDALGRRPGRRRPRRTLRRAVNVCRAHPKVAVLTARRRPGRTRPAPRRRPPHLRDLRGDSAPSANRSPCSTSDKVADHPGATPTS